MMEVTDSVCWYGKSRYIDGIGVYKNDTVLYNSLPEFPGWVDIVGDTTITQAAKDRMKLFVWRRIIDVPWADTLIPEDYDGPPRRYRYWEKPDYTIDGGFGGPIPLIGEGLGDLTFYVSYHRNQEAWGYPRAWTYRPYYTEETGNLNLTYRKKGLKINLYGQLGIENTLGISTRNVDAHSVQHMDNGRDIFWNLRSSAMFMPYYDPPYDINSTVVGGSIVHSLSPETFYSLRYTHTYSKHSCNNYQDLPIRDTTIVRYFGDEPVDEVPYGFPLPVKANITVQGLNTRHYGSMAAYVDSRSHRSTDIFKFDITSQINKYNQAKAGITVGLDNQHTDEWAAPAWKGRADTIDYKSEPIKAGVYLQVFKVFQPTF